MVTTADRARQQLVAALSRGFELPLAAQGMVTPDGPARNSAVLVLFGELDDVPAGSASRLRVNPAAAEPASADAVPARLDVLLTRRSSGLRNHAGQIAFPGGGVEDHDKDRTATALREAQEETGLDPAGVDVLGQLPDAHIPVSNYLVTPVLGWWRSPSEVAADKSESVEVFRVPVAELLDPAARGTSLLRHGGRTYKGQAFRLGPQFGGHVVWGFTAMLLSGIFDALGWAVPWDRSRTFEVQR